MRKVSKSRTDDDVISSTNGSVTNEAEDQPVETEQEPADEKEDTDQADQPEEGEDANENGNNSDDDPSFDEKTKDVKKKAPKSKLKKKKSTKAKKQEEYEVEKVVGAKKIKGKLHYLIRWKGYSADSDTWEPEHTVSCPDLISKFKDEQENSKKKDVSDSKSKTPTKRRGRPSKQSNSSPAKKSRKEEWDSENADENAEYEVDRILEVHHKKNGKREFLIHWKGWSTKFDSWEPEDNLNCADLIKKFMDKVNSARSKDARSLRVAPETTSRFTLQAPTTGRRLSKRGGQRQRVRYDDAE